MRVLEHGKFIMGPEVHELEKQLTVFSGAKHAVTCSSGTDALLLALMALEVGPGDAVLVPAFTFAATAEAVALLGATPIFCDVREDTFNLDPGTLDRAVDIAKTLLLRPRVIIAVDLFGQPADYQRITQFAGEHNLKLVADAAQSFGAKLGGRRVGTFGDETAVSFFPAKPLGCYGDGGAVLTDDDSLARALVSLREHGRGSNKYNNRRIGLNGRLDTLQAAVLLEKLAIFEDEINARQQVAQRYDVALGCDVRTPQLMANMSSMWAQYTILADDRDALARRLDEAEISTAIYYPVPLNRQTAYRKFPTASGGTPVSDRLAEHVLSLPIHPYLGRKAQDRIIAAVQTSM